MLFRSGLDGDLAMVERTLLALVEGWVDDVVTQAAAGRLPAADALRETMRRRRAAGGPAEKTFATLVGMELRPRLAREAATLFAVVRAGRGADARDALWMHPDLLPSPDDLADPLGFIEGNTQELEFEVPDDIGGLDELPRRGSIGEAAVRHHCPQFHQTRLSKEQPW